MQPWFKLLTKSQGKRLYWGIMWAALTLLSGVSLLMLSGWFISATAMAGIAISAGIVLLFDMYMPGSGIRFFALSRTVCRYTERIYNHDSVLRLIAVFRVSVFKKLSSLPISRLNDVSDSEWLGKLTADLDALDSILLRYTIAPIASLLVIIIITLFLSFVWLELALALGGYLILLHLFSIWLTVKSSKTLASASSSMLSDMRDAVIAHIRGAFELHARGLMAHHEQDLRAKLTLFNGIQAKLNARVANLECLLSVNLALALICLVFVALQAVSKAELDGPVAVMLVLMFMAIAEMLQSTPSQFSLWGKTEFAAKRLDELIVVEPVSSAVVLHSIESIDVQLNKHPKLPITYRHSLCFSVRDKQMTVIEGRSGSGKSTLANLLSGIMPLDNNSSSITINAAVPIANISTERWHAQLGYLEQSNTLFAESLAYNLTIGLQSVSEARIWSVLKMLALEDWAKKLPDGLNTWLGELGGQVSGGQARRICLARLLLREPTLLILDEPFNGIDAHMAERIWKNMAPWLSQRMVVLLIHEQPSFIQDSPNVQGVRLS